MALNTAGQTRTGNTPPSDFKQVKCGKIVYDATSITAADHTLVDLGFTPKYVRFCNLTDRIDVEWFDGMAADTCLKTAANGTRTLETTNLGVTVCDSTGAADGNGRAFKVSQNATLAVIAASKTCYWVAYA